VAATFSELLLFPGILNCAKENLAREEVYKLFLGTDYEGKAVFHVAAMFCNIEVFLGIMNCAKESLTRER
jgi:hypothetical protein